MMAIDRGTTRGGESKRKPQKYQNSYTYQHNKNSKLTCKIAALPIEDLCQRCTEILEWKKKYRKYKSLTVPKKCIKCAQKTIHEAYHVICNSCSNKDHICAKCQETLTSPDETTQSQFVIEEELPLHIVETMRERERRTYIRSLEKKKTLEDNDGNLGR
jgi:hypothetical protein